MSNLTPILRLPSELRLRILIDVVSNGPDPASPLSPFCCLEEYCQDYLKHRYAIFKMPEFRDLKITYPNAFKQTTAVVLAWTHDEQACAQQKARQEGRLCGSGYKFICYGLLQRHPAPLGPSAAQATIPQIVHGRSWSHHFTLPITDLNTVRLITDDRSPRATRDLLKHFLRSLRLTAAKLHFVNLIRSEHNHALLSRDSDKIQQACKEYVAILNTVNTSGVEKLELEVVDQVHENGRGVVVEFECATSGNGRRWFYDALEEIEPEKCPASVEHADVVASRSRLLVDPRLCKLDGENTWCIETPGWQVAVAISIWLVLLLAFYKAFILFRPSRPTGDSVHTAILEKERQITSLRLKKFTGLQLRRSHIRSPIILLAQS